MKPTLRAISKLAGVSHVTVSLALRNDPRISPATAKKVHAAAKRLGYVPDPRLAELMARLRLGRSKSGAVVIAFLGFVHPVYGAGGSPTARRFYRGAAKRAAELGYRLERFTAEADGLSIARVGAILRARSIRGVLVAPLAEDQGKLELPFDQLSVVMFSHTVQAPRMDRVCNHPAHTMRLALSTLAARGSRRPGLYLRDGVDARVDGAWTSTYVQHWMTLNPGTLPIPPVRGATWDRDDFAAWYREHRPDAVVTINGAVLDWMRALGIRVPRDTLFAHLDWSPEMGDVAGIDQESEQVGAAGLELVAAQLTQNIRGIPRSPKTLFIDGSWHEGRTVRRSPPHGSSAGI